MSLVKDTTFLFEVTPKHPTRKVYDHVLYPTGFAYMKKMTVRQAIAAFNTCNQLKVVYEDAYYPVTLENIEAVVAEIEAGAAPTIVEAVEAGVHTLASYITPVDKDTVLLGEWTTDRLADLKIENGDVSGVVYYVTGFTEFNSEKEIEQSGYYFPFAWTENDEYTSPKMRVLNGSNIQIDMDTENLIWLGNTQKDAEVKLIEISATNADGEEVKLTLKVLHVRFERRMLRHPRFMPGTKLPKPECNDTIVDDGTVEDDGTDEDGGTDEGDNENSDNGSTGSGEGPTGSGDTMVEEEEGIL